MLCTNGRKAFMHSMVRRGVVIGAGALLLLCAVIGLRGGTSKGQKKAAAARKVAAKASIADAYRFNIAADHPLALPGGAFSGPPQDADCFLILDMLVPWPMHLYKPGANVKAITLAIDPIHRMTPIYEFPTDLAVSGALSKFCRDCKENCAVLAKRLARRGRSARHGWRHNAADHCAHIRVSQLHHGWRNTAFRY